MSSPSQKYAELYKSEKSFINLYIYNFYVNINIVNINNNYICVFQINKK